MSCVTFTTTSRWGPLTRVYHRQCGQRCKQWYKWKGVNTPLSPSVFPFSFTLAFCCSIFRSSILCSTIFCCNVVKQICGMGKQAILPVGAVAGGVKPAGCLRIRWGAAGLAFAARAFAFPSLTTLYPKGITYCVASALLILGFAGGDCGCALFKLAALASVLLAAAIIRFTLVTLAFKLSWVFCCAFVTVVVTAWCLPFLAARVAFAGNARVLLLCHEATTAARFTPPGVCKLLLHDSPNIVQDTELGARLGL